MRDGRTTELTETTDPVLRELLSLLQRPAAGVPKSVVESVLAEKSSQDDCRHAIEYALDNYLIDLVVDYPLRKWDFPEDSHVWHYRKLSPKSARSSQDLKPVHLALVKLLWQQNEPKCIGEMREKDARVELANQGFGEQELKLLWIDGLVDCYWAFEDDENTKWIRLIPEYEKTPEFKHQEEKLEEWAARREALHTRMTEDMEKEEKLGERKGVRYQEKRSKRQST